MDESESEDALLQRLRAGGQAAEDALVALFERMRRRLLALLVRRGASTAQAENVVQDTFIKAFQNLTRFRGDASVRTWITGMALNQLTDELRHDRRLVDAHSRVAMHDDDDGDALSVLADLVWQAPSAQDDAELRRLQRCIGEHYPAFERDHPDKAQQLEHIVSDGWSARELAAAVGIDEAAARKRLQRIKALIAEYLAPCQALYGGRVL